MNVKRKLDKLEKLLDRDVKVYTLSDREEIYSLPDNREIYLDYTPLYNTLRRFRGVEEEPPGTDTLRRKAGDIKAMLRFLERRERDG